VCLAHFCDNLHQVCSKLKNWNAQWFESLSEQENQKSLNRITRIDYTCDIYNNNIHKVKIFVVHISQIDMMGVSDYFNYWFCLFIYLWVLTFPLEDCSEFGNFVITLIYKYWYNLNQYVGALIHAGWSFHAYICHSYNFWYHLLS
jgi:hypothetical protein